MPDANAIPRTPPPEDQPDWWLRLKDRLGLLDAIQVVPYRSIGTPALLHLRGRVLECKGIEGQQEESPVWRNALNALRRFQSEDIPGARLRASFQGQQWETQSDDEGFFIFNLPLEAPVASGWHTVTLELVESIGQPAERRLEHPVMVPSSEAAFAVVSDVDDTIISTHSTDLLEELSILFGKGAKERETFPGVPDFYRALTAGAAGAEVNPIFYVSRSGWNLYDLFVAFMAQQGLPRGPLFLSDLQLFEEKSKLVGRDHDKFESIDLLLRTYPELPFVLIGDSGMKDPELYYQLAQAHPGRIAAIYIHDVSPDARDREVDQIADALAAEGVALVRGETVAEAAQHAARSGFISPDDLKQIHQILAFSG